jgi:UDP-2,3-diacylglucosamine pyrophosphatase LpxH
MVSEEKDKNYVFVSDLHLSEGFLVEENHYDRNEDFFYDDAFARFLAYLQKQREDGKFKKPWRLVINGDFLDFLQVTTCPEGDYGSTRVRGKDYQFKIRKKERSLGLGHTMANSLWKLDRIFDGHPEFFEAIAGFLAYGNDLIIITGNHDAEFTYPEVRELFREKLEFSAEDFFAYNREKLRTSGLPGKDETVKNVSARVYFVRWYYYEKGLFYAEHGCQYDTTNRYDFFLDPTIHVSGEYSKRRFYEEHSHDNGCSKGEELAIWFPVGSFFVRYLFNEIEKYVPFTDNIRPKLSAFRWLRRNRKDFVVYKILTLWPFIKKFVGRKILSRISNVRYYERKWYEERNDELLRAIEGNGIIRENGADPGTDGLDWNTVELIYKHISRPKFRYFRETVNWIGINLWDYMITFVFLVPAAILFYFLIPGFATKIGLWVVAAFGIPILFIWLYLNAQKRSNRWVQKNLKPNQYLYEAAEKLAPVLGDVKYVIFGHTHVAYDKRIGNTEKKVVNTGSWTPVFDEKMILRHSGIEFPFIRIITEEVPKKPVRTTDYIRDIEANVLHWNDELGEPQRIRLIGEEM